jgi:putative transposase
MVISLKNPGAPGSVADTLTEILREGAQQLLASAIEAEVRAFLQRFQAEKTTEGLQRVLRNGRLPKRTLQTGIGAIEISLPRVRDHEGKLRFTSALLPPYLRGDPRR